MYLDSLNLSDLPKGLERLPLWGLNLSNNRLTHFLGKEERGFPGLTRLDLSDNPLSLEALSRLRELTSLRLLNLDRVPLERLPDSLNALTQLTSVYMQRCGLTEANFGALPQLEALSMRGNQLTIPPDITGCPSLKSVNLENNRLVAMPDIRNHPGPVRISLASNQLTTLPDWLFEVGLPEESSLDVGKNPLDAATLERLQAHQRKEGMGRISH